MVPICRVERPTGAETWCFLFYPCNTPFASVVRSNNYVYFCIVNRLSRLTLHIVKVFFASPLLKMWKFS